MPELPEVETTRRGIAPHVTGERVAGVVVRDRRLRWPIDPVLEQILTGQRIRAVRRRAKYLLLETADGSLIVHLGMSGSLRIVALSDPPQTHDHVDIVLDKRRVLRFNDPRRFGCILWHEGSVDEHRLLKHLGPEPLHEGFSADYMYRLSRGRKAPIKSFLMDSRVVVGVGNIYANEALYRSGIHPLRRAGRVSQARYERLVDAVRGVLGEAIADGGTTLRDFVGSDGRPGYFRQHLAVYGRGGEPCRGCGVGLCEVRLAQRTTVFCPACQR